MAKREQVEEAIKKYFDKRKYSYDTEEKEAFVLYSGFKTTTDNDVIGVVFVVHDNDVGLTATYSGEQHPDNYMSIAEFLLRVNRFLKRGHFFLDYETGSINFKVWSGMKGRFSDQDVSNMISLAIGSLEACIPKIKSIVSGETSPVGAAEAYISRGDSDEE